MAQSIEAQVRDALPEVTEITDDALREMVLQVWVDAVEASEFESVDDAPWSATYRPVVGPDERQVNHVREVLACALAFAETLQSMRPGLDIDRDRLVAGTLLHDVSKYYEISSTAIDDPDGELRTDVDTFLPHPHYGIYLTAEAGLPLEVINMVAAHAATAKVDPLTIEAKILEAADLLVAACVLWEHTGEIQ